MKLVSVVIPVYNREKTILRAIESVFNQSYSNIEIVVVDDCSTDNSISVITEKYKDEKRISIIRLEKNSGACKARNTGIEHSKGEYIAFLDSDDAFYKNKIELQVDVIEDTNSDICASAFDRYDLQGCKTLIDVPNYSGEKLYNELLFNNFITTGTILGKRKCFQEICFDEELPRLQDWDISLRLAQRFNFCLLNISTLMQEAQENSITFSTSYDKTIFALDRILEKNNDQLKRNTKALGYFKWRIGCYSLFTDNIRKRELYDGATLGGFNIKRFLIYIMSIIGMKKIARHLVNV